MAKGDLNKNIEGAKETMGELLFATRDFSDEVKKSAKEVFGIGTSANAATKSFKDISSSLRDMSSQMDEIVKGNVTVKDLAKEQEKYAKTQAKFQVEYSQALNKANATLGKNKISQEKINGILHNNLSLEEAFGDSVVDIEKSSLRLLESFTQQAKINTENDVIMSNMADRAKKIEKGVGLAGAAFGSMGAILEKAGLGNIGSKMGLDVAVKEGRKLSAELTNGGVEAAGLGTKLKVAGKMAGTIGKNLMKSFGPIAIIGFLIKELIESFILVDEASGKVAQNLGISYQQASDLTQEYEDQSNLSKEMVVTGKQHLEAQNQLNEKFQTGGKFSAKIANDYASIQRRTGLTAKSMDFLVKGQIKGEKTIEEQLKTLHKTVAQFGIQNKMVLNVNKVMEKITTASKSIHLFTKGNVAELAKTVMVAQKFGAEMSTIEGIGSSLLDFESSLQNELQAELLLGQDINLEKARQYALTGDTAKLTEELMGQEAILNAFATNNVIAQEAAAKALGLSRNELAEIVMSQKEQQALQDTFGDGIKDINGAYDSYKEKLAEGKTEQEIFNELGNKNLANQLESLSLAEQTADAKEKERERANEISRILIETLPTIQSMIEGAKKFGKYIAAIVVAWKTFQFISAVVLGIQTAIGLAKQKSMQTTTASLPGETAAAGIATTQAAATVATASAATLGIGAISIIAGIAAVMGGLALYTMSDGVIGPGGEMVVSGPKGSIQLDKDDSIIAGTNLGGKGKGNNNDNNNPPPDNSEMLGLLKQIANKSPVIEMGGNEVGQGINTAEREIQ